MNCEERLKQFGLTFPPSGNYVPSHLAGKLLLLAIPAGPGSCRAAVVVAEGHYTGILRF